MLRFYAEHVYDLYMRKYELYCDSVYEVRRRCEHVEICDVYVDLYMVWTQLIVDRLLCSL
jgi:hypothetical protein